MRKHNLKSNFRDYDDEDDVEPVVTTERRPPDWRAQAEYDAQISKATIQYWIDYVERSPHYNHIHEVYPPLIGDVDMEFRQDGARELLDDYLETHPWDESNPTPPMPSFTDLVSRAPSLYDRQMDERKRREEARVRALKSQIEKLDDKVGKIRDNAWEGLEKAPDGQGLARDIIPKGQPGYTPTQYGMTPEDWDMIDTMAALPTRPEKDRDDK